MSKPLYLPKSIRDKLDVQSEFGDQKLQRNCVYCGKPYTPKTKFNIKNQKYCSSTCQYQDRLRAERRKHREDLASREMIFCVWCHKQIFTASPNQRFCTNYFGNSCGNMFTKIRNRIFKLDLADTNSELRRLEDLGCNYRFPEPRGKLLNEFYFGHEKPKSGYGLDVVLK